MHGVKYEAEARIAEFLPVHQFFKCLEIRRARLKELNEVLLRWQRRHVRALHDFEIAFNLRHYGRQSRAAVARFVLDAIPWIGVVARGDPHATSRPALPHEQGNRRGWTGLVRQKSVRAAAGHNLGSSNGDLVPGETIVITDGDTPAPL